MADRIPNDILDAWAIGPKHALDRVPVSLRAAVLRRMLSKIEQRDPYRPKRLKRGRPRKDDHA